MSTAKKLYAEHTDYEQVSLTDIRRILKERAPLEAFAFQEIVAGEQLITIESAELTCICPFSELPDFGRVLLIYVPEEKCLELKSFKLYLGAFRDLKIFHEGVTEVILADVIDAVAPRYAELTVEMNPRGNVKTVCHKEFGKRSAI